MELTRQDRQLLQEVARGLPRCPRPYAEIGKRIGLGEAEVIRRIDGLLASGIIGRFGVVVRHHELGYRANAMVVWDVPDAAVENAAARLVDLPFVTLCYERPRRLPDWPYNLYCMIHGRSREQATGLIEAATEAAGLADCPRAILFSRRRFKQRGAHIDATVPSLEAAE